MKVVDLKTEKSPSRFIEGTEWDRVTQDYIRQYKGVISSEDCKHIIDTHKNLPTTALDEWDDQYWVESTNNSTRMCDLISIKDEKIDAILFNAFTTMLTQYAQDNWRAASFMYDTGYTLIRFNEGDSTPIHHSPSGYSICAFIFLNNDCDGGELQFFAKSKTEVSVGGGVIFPAAFMFPNEILPVTKGVRYAVKTEFRTKLPSDHIHSH